MDSYIDKITKLEAENLELSNMHKQQIEKTYSLRVDKDAEITALKSKLKIASAALEVVKVHNGINAHYPIVYATVTQALRDVGEI
ncbi:MAG: hypothetical protein KBE16_00590 [Alphaproteobacteria bacterium]|nr:hypothetical protein [Alphaproteobacteria bacterium]